MLLDLYWTLVIFSTGSFKKFKKSKVYVYDSEMRKVKVNLLYKSECNHKSRLAGSSNKRLRRLLTRIMAFHIQ